MMRQQPSVVTVYIVSDGTNTSLVRWVWTEGDVLVISLNVIATY